MQRRPDIVGGALSNKSLELFVVCREIDLAICLACCGLGLAVGVRTVLASFCCRLLVGLFRQAGQRVLYKSGSCLFEE